ncbi:MAG: glycosyltransferase family 1 protein [Oxalobacter sp.]|nr:glycosyltransferase family 1 protein [Oxalobacter sp.]
MHLIDISQCYVPECRKIRSYFTAKSKWLSGFSHVRHTLVVPGFTSPCENGKMVRIPSIRIPFFPGFRLSRSRKSIEFLIKSMHPDCIEVSDPFQFARAAVNIRQESNILIGAFCHFHPAYITPWRLGSEKQAIRKLIQLYSHFDLVFASSMSLLEKFHEYGLKQIRYLPPGIDTAVFHPDTMDCAMRDRLGLKEKTRLLAYVEYTPGHKNREVLFEAMQRLDDRYHLLVIGSNPKNINNDRVSYFYFHQQTHPPEMLATLIASCDVLIHPELHQNYPLSILEAMSCGLPVVGFDSGSFKEFVDEHNGICVDAICPQKLAEGIALAYEKGIMSMGSAARKRAEKNHDWQDLLARWWADYVSLLASKGNYPKDPPGYQEPPSPPILH